ncbi:hypothetical protein MHYP_G00173000 [Metynnis hypsauchen]
MIPPCLSSIRFQAVELLSAGLSHPACKLEILRLTRCKITEIQQSKKIILEGLGEHRDIENLHQYEFSLTLDPNSALVNVKVSEGDKEAWYNWNRQQPLPENPERFKPSSLVMCREALTGRHFCQVEWFGRFATIGVAYKDISRKGRFTACSPGYNKKSFNSKWTHEQNIKF